MPGLVPGIHVLAAAGKGRHGWPGRLARMRASRFCPAMTAEWLCEARSKEPRALLSRLEDAVGGVPGGALFGHGRLQPLDFRSHQRDALGKFLDRQQRQVLPDLVGDFLSWLVVVLDRHAFSSVLNVNGCQPKRGWLIRCLPNSSRVWSRTNHGTAARAN